ncbi:hypothetical protein CEXT_585631 [Caerostris extrusa]|uniref:Uncharacterized protein n=1 Tax=Caerostris extrusa TaxID=172846 RepID=A0AAV4Y561_CAEEX|nr:hypothetical protein CEXT_585631 [Caerostris extrusa]
MFLRECILGCPCACQAPYQTEIVQCERENLSSEKVSEFVDYEVKEKVFPIVLRAADILQKSKRKANITVTKSPKVRRIMLSQIIISERLGRRFLPDEENYRAPFATT